MRLGDQIHASRTVERLLRGSLERPGRQERRLVDLVAVLVERKRPAVRTAQVSEPAQTCWGRVDQIPRLLRRVGQMPTVPLERVDIRERAPEADVDRATVLFPPVPRVSLEPCAQGYAHMLRNALPPSTAGATRHHAFRCIHSA